MAIDNVFIEQPQRQHPDDLASVGVPQRKRVEDGAGAERGDEGVDLRHLDEQAVDQPISAAHATTMRIASGHGTP